MKLSESLRALMVNHADAPLSVGTLVKAAGEHGFGLVTGLLILPMLIPIPIPLPGFSTVIGSGIIILGIQLALARPRPYLPDRLTRLTFSPDFSRSLLNNLHRLLRPIERISRPRLLQISQNRKLHRLLGVCMVWNAALMSLPLPIPFTNLIPGYTILIQAISLLEADGLLMLISYGLTLATTLFFVGIANTIWALTLQLIHTLFP